MLHNEARERLVEGYEQTWNAAMIAEIEAHPDKTPASRRGLHVDMDIMTEIGIVGNEAAV